MSILCVLASSQRACFINKQILGGKKAAETSDKKFHITLNSVAGTNRIRWHQLLPRKVRGPKARCRRSSEAN
jgi:hypothetical protein